MLHCLLNTECGIRCQNGGSANGNCTSCVCSSRYTGLQCEKEVDYCDNNQCGIYGTCVNDFEAKSYNCSCKEGWEGPDCSHCNIEHCKECIGDSPLCVLCEIGYNVSLSGIFS